MDRSFINKIFDAHHQCAHCPSPKVVAEWYSNLCGSLFPDFASRKFSSERELELHLEELRLKLDQILARNPIKINSPSNHITDRFFDMLPEIHTMLQEDVTAIYEGDPAAKSRIEVIRTYPGFMAISAHRFAHALDELGVGLIPRIISEYAHGMTGIDIHPSASIGRHFCIDHGTGIVIGETTKIGEHVKIYQGVTLGALSVDKKDAEVKRHPTIEDRVVIYSGATILGGDTTIGHDSVVGGNVWLTTSIPAFSKVYYEGRMRKDQHEPERSIVHDH